MSDPVDPLFTTAVRDPHASASGDRDETAIAPSPGGAPVPGFGPPAAAGEVGTLGPYRILKELGKGGMGAVYLALDTRLERQLALKVMLPEFAADREAKARFLREARAVAQISHDNVVTVFEADERDGVPYIAMQFLKGYPLDQFLKAKGTPSLPNVIRIARETALGLAAAHQLGLVHRDIKPANLWLESPNGRVKVLDFGLAKPIGSASELTKSGTMVGTPAYMSPEQARGLKVDHRSDLYSLGAVLYRLCAGRNPFAGDHAMAVLAAVLTDEPTPVRALNPNVPEALARLIHELLAKTPDARPQTGNDVARRLRGILDQLLAPAAPAGAVPTAGDVSNSLPVVVHSLPGQPSPGVPVQIAARPEDAFANLDDDDGAEETEAEAVAAAAPRSERPTRRKGARIAAGVAVLLAVVVGGVVVSQTGAKNAPEAKAPDATPRKTDPQVKTDPKGKTDPQVKTVPAGPIPAAHTNGIGMQFVKVPKGTGWLGSWGGKPGETKVEFTEDFYLGKYEVTQEEWETITGSNPSHFSRNGHGADAVKDISDAELKRFPVEQVSWEDCQLFIQKLNEREKESGWVYRLPKESEWEYAGRGGPVDKADSAFEYYFAKPTMTLLPEQANFNNGLKRTCKVGSYESNALGLHDMHGNVWEWCDDATLGASGPTARVNRGGHWHNNAWTCRLMARCADPPSQRYNALGLRLARVPSVPAGK